MLVILEGVWANGQVYIASRDLPLQKQLSVTHNYVAIGFATSPPLGVNLFHFVVFKTPRDPGHRRPRERDTLIANSRGLSQEHSLFCPPERQLAWRTGNDDRNPLGHGTPKNGRPIHSVLAACELPGKVEREA